MVWEQLDVQRPKHGRRHMPWTENELQMDHRTKCKIIILVEETIGENLHEWGLGNVCLEIRASQVALVVKNPPANAADVRDLSLIPGLGKSPGGGLGNSLQYSCLENPMDWGAWQATVHRVAESQIKLRWLIMHIVSLPPQAHTLSDTECNYFHERKNLEVDAVPSFYFLK